MQFTYLTQKNSGRHLDLLENVLTVSMQWSLERGREKIFRTGFRVRAGGRECNADFPLGRRNPVLPTAGKELEGLELWPVMLACMECLMNPGCTTSDPALC